MSEQDEDVVRTTDARPYPFVVLRDTRPEKPGLLERLLERLLPESRLLAERDEARAWAQFLLLDKRKAIERAERAEADVERLRAENLKLAGNFLAYAVQVRTHAHRLVAASRAQNEQAEALAKEYRKVKAERDQLLLKVCQMEAEAFMRNNGGNTYVS